MIKMIHSGWAYVALILILVAVISAVIGMNSNKEFSKKSRSIALFALIASHIQMLFGFGAYFSSPGYMHLKQEGMGDVMKNAIYRNQIMEHPLMMLIGIILITVGWMKHKNKSTSKAKFKTIAVFYGIGLLLILAKIPWGVWFQH